jgi:CheY-like chemotaxis protein
VTLEADLPAAWIDRLRIRQVLLNLLVNAARHTERGFVRVSASVQVVDLIPSQPTTSRNRFMTQVPEILIRVQDSGRGISKQDLQKIFTEFSTTEEPFSQWHSGAGLGLPISKKFVELHQGRMGVESTYGEGASFWFTLPTVTTTPIDQPATTPTRYHPLVRLNAVERIIIVVHPDLAVTNLLKRYLTGYQVIAVSDQEHGVAQGIALANEVKALALITSAAVDQATLPDHTANLLIIHCALPDTRQVVSQLGVDNILIKPVGRQELLAAVDALALPLHRILIVDDDPEVVRLFRRILRARVPVQNCLEAYNGREALTLLRQEKPDLVLLDLMMPEVDGRALLAQMAADPTLAAIPVILISARGQDQANLHVAGPVQVLRPAGQELGAIIQLLTLLLDGLTVGWQGLATNAPTPAITPAVSPALADTQPPPATAPTAAH